jgi:poly-beta-hydroxybutyrate-responsive repressor
MANQSKKPGSGAAGDMLTAHLLAMLKGWTAYGYDLAQRLEEAGLGDYNKGTIYRTLRHMEALGLVSSNWDTSLNGPARRMYSLTNAGSLFLQNWLAILDAHKSMVAQFVNLSAPTETGAPAPSRQKKSRKKAVRKKAATQKQDELRDET